MKKLTVLAFTATALCLSIDSFSQSIILVNGQPTEVVLEGTQITDIIKPADQGHMNGYTTAPLENFSKAKVRLASSQMQVQNTEKKKRVFPVILESNGILCSNHEE